MKTVTILMPFGVHHHFRFGPQAELIASLIADIFCGAIAMGNLPDPIKDWDDALWYREEEIGPFLPKDFILRTPIMLTGDTTLEMVKKAWENGIKEIKYIPNATSHNSQNGIPLYELLYSKYNRQLAFMEEVGMRLLIHLELTGYPDGETITFFYREYHAIPYGVELIKKFPRLLITFEHISTEQLLDMVHWAPSNVMGTVTPQHLWLTYDDVFHSGGEIKNPHNFCLPVAKSEADREALIQYVTSEKNTKIMLGTDSALHPEEDKRLPNPKPGIWNLLTALPVYISVFEKAGQLGNQTALDNFFYNNAARCYGLPPSTKTLTLVKNRWQVPGKISRFGVTAVPWLAGQNLDWQIQLQKKGGSYEDILSETRHVLSDHVSRSLR